MVDEEGELENAREMESQCEDDRRIEGPDSITVIQETSIVIVTQRVTFDLDTRESYIEYPFNYDE